MDVEGDGGMEAAQGEERGSRPFCVYTQRSSYPWLVDIFKRRWQNFKIRWQNLMKWEPAHKAACVRILKKVPGLRQSAQAGMHVLARAFWMLVFVLCVFIVYYIIREGIRRTMGHPLTVTIETEEINIGDAKFPQVGISPNGGFKLRYMRQAWKNYFEEWDGKEVRLKDGRKWSKNEVEGIMKVIYHTCHPGTTNAHKNGVNIPEDVDEMFGENTKIQGTHLDNPEEAGMKSKVIPLMKEGMINCDEIIRGCLLNGKSYDCKVLFKEHFSEWGSTCVFNGIPTEATRRNETIQSKLGGSTKEEIKEWEQADLDEDVANVEKKNDTKHRPAVPWRQMAPGKSSGLTFVIRENLEDRACVHSDDTGFMLAVNNPRDEPQIERFGTSLPYGKEIYVSLYPEVILAEKDAKDISMDRRGCYFSDDEGDAHLDFYKKYSRQNCLEECFAKAVYEKCKCAKVSSPEEMHNQGLKAACPKCRPNCRDTKYRTSVTWSRMTEDRMNYYQKMFYGKDYRGNRNISVSVVNVYFVVDSVHPTRRSARYSTFEEVGLIGGTVSMITGLSLLDVIETLVLIAVIVVSKYKVWNNLGRMGGPSFKWKLAIPKCFRRNNRVAPEEIEMAEIPRPVERQALPGPRRLHPMENMPGYLP
ncbi:uncharacterized protein LOC110854873 [Folsomia candida]|uniref:uncharacterized protein LOC110854873 n=1 Tax=Folsomia candida TaxID=158441 RepID=UPI000B8F1117|nr:uncharacterized protein LOC110854873 [Folsomia candida]